MKKEQDMKALEELNSTEKGRLLMQLFPSHLTALVDYIGTTCKELREQEAQLRKEWNSRSIVTADYWFDLVGQAEKLIGDLHFTLERNPKVFADQFFYSHLAVFTIDCICSYAETVGTENRFRKAVELLF
jgi:hypothetical protein